MKGVKKTLTQDLLVSTIHNLDEVIETYFNVDQNIISEIQYKSNNRVLVYQHELELYLKEKSGSKNIRQIISEITNL